jgi:FtsP/CotA-like multicopper oxidase with cupredoxin domain
MILSRRRLTIGCAATASCALLSGRLGNSEPAPFTTPLPLPQLIDAAASRHAVNLIAMADRHAFVEGKPARTYGYSAPVLGPVIRVRRGDEVQMFVENRLNSATTVHWHGLLVPGHSDGGPQQLIHPGEHWQPVLKIDQPAATLWFHPHPHGDTARQICMGLTGMIIVDDGSDARLGLPRAFGLDDFPLILQDRELDADGSIEYDNKTLDALDIAYGARGDTVIVNGAITPVAKLRATVQRPTSFSCHRASQYRCVSHQRDCRLMPIKEAISAWALASRRLAHRSLLRTNCRRLRSRSRTTPGGTLAKLGTSEVWEITSIGMAHPFHVHGALFRVLSIEGEPPPPYLAGWKDTLLVEDKAELLVAFNQRATRSHPFMYHCHILEHEDAGLMGQYVCA